MGASFNSREFSTCGKFFCYCDICDGKYAVAAWRSDAAARRLSELAKKIAVSDGFDCPRLEPSVLPRW